MKKKLFAEAYLHPKHRDYTFMFRIVSCNKVNLPADFVNNFMQNRNSKEMKSCSKKQIILSRNQNSYYMCNYFPSRSSQDRENSGTFSTVAKFAAFSKDLFSSLKFKFFYFAKFVIVAFSSILDCKLVLHCKNKFLLNTQPSLSFSIY